MLGAEAAVLGDGGQKPFLGQAASRNRPGPRAGGARALHERSPTASLVGLVLELFDVSESTSSKIRGPPTCDGCQLDRRARALLVGARRLHAASLWAQLRLLHRRPVARRTPPRCRRRERERGPPRCRRREREREDCDSAHRGCAVARARLLILRGLAGVARPAARGAKVEHRRRWTWCGCCLLLQEGPGTCPSHEQLPRPRAGTLRRG